MQWVPYGILRLIQSLHSPLPWVQDHPPRSLVLPAAAERSEDMLPRYCYGLGTALILRGMGAKGASTLECSSFADPEISYAW